MTCKVDNAVEKPYTVKVLKFDNKDKGKDILCRYGLFCHYYCMSPFVHHKGFFLKSTEQS